MASLKGVRENMFGSSMLNVPLKAGLPNAGRSRHELIRSFRGITSWRKIARSWAAGTAILHG